MATIYSSNEVIPEDPIYLTITGTSGSEIRYTTDGTIPTSSSNLYSEPIEMHTGDEVCARQYMEGYQPSDSSYFLNYTPQINIQKMCSLSEQIVPSDNTNYTNDRGECLRYSFKLYKQGDYYFLLVDLHGANKGSSYSPGSSAVNGNDWEEWKTWDTSECYFKSLIFYSKDMQTWSPISLFNNGEIISGATKKRILSHNLPKDIFFYKGNYYFVYLKVDDNYLSTIEASTTDYYTRSFHDNTAMSENYNISDSAGQVYIFKTKEPFGGGENILLEQNENFIEYKASCQIAHLLGENFIIIATTSTRNRAGSSSTTAYNFINFFISQDEGITWFNKKTNNISGVNDYDNCYSSSIIFGYFCDGNYNFLIKNLNYGEQPSSYYQAIDSAFSSCHLYSTNDPINKNFTRSSFNLLSTNGFPLNLIYTQNNNWLLPGLRDNLILNSTVSTNKFNGLRKGCNLTGMSYHKGYISYVGSPVVAAGKRHDVYSITDGNYSTDIYWELYCLSNKITYNITDLPEGSALFTTKPLDGSKGTLGRIVTVSQIFQPEGEEDHAFITLYEGNECQLYEITYSNGVDDTISTYSRSVENENPIIHLRLEPVIREEETENVE